MTETPTHNREEIFAFGIEPSDAPLPDVRPADDQEPRAPTEAAAVAEAMGGELWRTA